MKYVAIRPGTDLEKITYQDLSPVYETAETSDSLLILDEVCAAMGCHAPTEGACCACKSRFCHAHLYRATEADGEPRDRCFDCCEPPDREW